jgi:hypothetical protein
VQENFLEKFVSPVLSKERAGLLVGFVVYLKTSSQPFGESSIFLKNVASGFLDKRRDFCGVPQKSLQILCLFFGEKRKEVRHAAKKLFWFGKGKKVRGWRVACGCMLWASFASA